MAAVRWAVAAVSLLLLVLAGTRLWLVEGWLRRITIDGPSVAPALCGPHYEVRCGDCGFPFRIDAEQPPAAGRAACPNCGFADNPLDSARLQPPHRVLIDRWPLLWRSPQPGEVVAAILPLPLGERRGEGERANQLSNSPHPNPLPQGEGTLAVKRVGATGPGQLAIRGGDLYLDADLIRKSPAELRNVRLLVHDNDYQPRKTPGLPRWRGEADDSRWRAEGSGFRLPAADSADSSRIDWLRYEHWAGTADPRLRGVATPIRDNDPYNQGDRPRPLNIVPDVLLSCRLRAEGEGRLALAAVDGEQRFEAIIEPGKRVILLANNRPLDERRLALNFSRRPVEVEFGLCDQQVLLTVAGRTILRAAYDRPAEPPTETLHPLAFGASGLAVELSQLRVWRDIYYLDPQSLSRPWQAAAPLLKNDVALLGDNPPVSIDSRHWQPPGLARSSLLGPVQRPFWAP